MTTPTRIFMLRPVETGECGICEQTTILRFRDASTGLRVGQCCITALIGAEQALIAAGLKHPNPETRKEQP